MEPTWAWPIEVRYSADDEAALVKAAQADPSAFTALYDHYLERVYRYLRLRAPGNDEATDMTQQVFLQAFGALSTYRSEGVPFAAWLFRIARNVAIDAHRQRRETTSWDLLPELAVPGWEHDPEEAAVRTEALLRLRELVVQLPTDKRELLALRFAAQLTSKEIGVVMGKSEAAVYKQLQRLIRDLREQYDG